MAEQAEAADAISEPHYVVKKVEQKDIEAASRRTALDNWLIAPMAEQAKREQQLLKYLGG